MTVTIVLSDEQTIQLLQDLMGWALVCRNRDFEEDAEATSELMFDLFDQVDDQLGVEG